MSEPESDKSPQEQLVDRINVIHNVRLIPEKVKFGIPELINTDINDLSQPTLRNSRVEITYAEGEPYEFKTTLYFNRLSLEELFLSRDKSFPRDFTHSHQLLPLLSERLRFTVTEDDIADHVIEYLDAPTLHLLLVAAPSSFILYGQVAISLRMTPEGTVPLVDYDGALLQDKDSVNLMEKE